MYIFLYPQFFQEWQYIDLTSYSKAEYFYVSKYLSKYSALDYKIKTVCCHSIK